MEEEPVQIPVRGAPIDWVSGIWSLPEGNAQTAAPPVSSARTGAEAETIGEGAEPATPPLPEPEAKAQATVPCAVLLAHGAGVGMHSAFMTQVATHLAESGYPVLRFQYAYAERMEREGTRRPPDKRPILEAVHRNALDFLRIRFPETPVVLAGKSMGARMASYLAAGGTDTAGLCFFGYPLHPAGKPDRLRTDQFPNLQTKTLFLQGTRDALCDLELLRPALETIAGPVTLEILEGADHSFQVLKRSGTTDDATFADMLQRTTAWLQTLPGPA